MKGLFTLLALCISLYSAQAQWQLGASPSAVSYINRGLERVGDELWVGAYNFGLYRSLDGHSWMLATFFPTNLDIYDIYAESPESVLVLACDNGPMTVYRLEKTGVDWTITAQFPLPVNCCSNIAKVYRMGNRILVFGECWSRLIGLEPNGSIAFNLPATRQASNGGEIIRSYAAGNGITNVAVSADGGSNWTTLYTTTEIVSALYVDADYIWVARENQTIARKNRASGLVQTFPVNGTTLDLIDLWLRFGTLGDTLTLSTNFDWFYSTNDGASWQLYSNFGNATQAFDVMKQIPEWPVAFGLGNDIIRTDNHGASWYTINRGIGAYSVLSLERNGNETALFAGVDNPARPLYRSLNNGQSWQPVTTTPFTGHQFNDMQWMGASSMFVLENNSLYFTPDLGDTWSQLSTSADFPATKLDGYFWKVYAQGADAIRRYNVDGTFEATLQPAPAVPGNPICDFSPWGGEWYLLMQNGDFYFSIDDGQSWTFRSHPFFGENPLRLTRINNNLIWWSADHVLYSNDGGINWLPADFPGYDGSLLNDVASSNGTGCFAALNGLGVFSSVDDGATWAPANDGLYNPNIYALMIVNNAKVYAGSHRGGIWNADVSSVVLRGQVYNDANQNNQFDSGDQPMANVVMKASPSGQLTTTDPSGIFIFPYAPGQNDFISLVGLNVPGATVNPPSAAISQPVSNLKFAVTNLPQTDLLVDAASLDAFRPGENNTISLEYSNKGIAEASGIVLECVLPAGVSLNSAAPLPDFVNGATLQWLPGNLPAGASDKILLDISLDANLSAGTVLRFATSARSNETDADPADNEDVFQTVLLENGTATPLKEVDRGILTLSEIAAGKPLEFTLRFQNTGSSEAHLLVITDELDASLDPATIQLLGSSHPCVWKISGTHQLTVIFPDLSLPPSSDDPEGSRGYARFSVKARQAVPLGTLITNQSSMAFDFEQPFGSNTTETKVQIYDPADPLLHLGLPMGARPNPAVTYLIADWNYEADAPGRLTMTDAGGVVWVDLPVAVGQYDAQFSVSDLPAGAYVLFVDAGSRHFVRTVFVAHPDANRRN